MFFQTYCHDVSKYGLLCLVGFAHCLSVMEKEILTSLLTFNLLVNFVKLRNTSESAHRWGPYRCNAFPVIYLFQAAAQASAKVSDNPWEKAQASSRPQQTQITWGNLICLHLLHSWIVPVSQRAIEEWPVHGNGWVVMSSDSSLHSTAPKPNQI